MMQIKFPKKVEITVPYCVPPFPHPSTTFPSSFMLFPLFCSIFLLIELSLLSLYRPSVSVSSFLSLLPRLSSKFSVYMYVNLTGSFKNILLTTLAVYIFPLNILGGSKLSSKRCFMGKGRGRMYSQPLG